MQKKGILLSWKLNGYGMIGVDDCELYFLHRTNISSGAPEVGAVVEFDVAPAKGNGKFAQATNAIVTAVR